MRQDKVHGFYAWLLLQLDRDDMTGDLARDAAREGYCAVSDDLESWLTHTRYGIVESVTEAWWEYKSWARPKSQPRSKKEPSECSYCAEPTRAGNMACHGCRQEREALEGCECSGCAGLMFAVDGGAFYIIQLEPTLDPNRVKMGYSKQLDKRLKAHRCAAPLARIVSSWPAKRTWEKTAMDSLSRGAERLHTEVFRVDDLEKLIQSADAFFALMPELER